MVQYAFRVGVHGSILMKLITDSLTGLRDTDDILGSKVKVTDEDDLVFFLKLETTKRLYFIS